MTDPIEHIRRIIERHRQEHEDRPGGTRDSGAETPPDDARHLAEEIVKELELRSERARDQMRYVSAWIDDELTKLEGAE